MSSATPLQAALVLLHFAIRVGRKLDHHAHRAFADILVEAAANEQRRLLSDEDFKEAA
jgi:hypothetical protein